MLTDSHADIIIKFEKLNKRLKPFGMHISTWGLMAVAYDTDPHGHTGFAMNNIKDIAVIEGFVTGLECAARLAAAEAE